MSAFLRLKLPEERILPCGAFRRRLRNKNPSYPNQVKCEKHALHGFGCLMSPDQRTAAQQSEAAYSLVRVIQREAQRHAGRDTNGKWYFWETW